MTESSEWAKWSTVIENIKRGIVVLNSSEGKALTVMGGATWPSEEPWLIQIIGSTSTPFELWSYSSIRRPERFSLKQRIASRIGCLARFNLRSTAMALIVLKQHVVGKPEPSKDPMTARRLRQVCVGKDRVRTGHRTSG